MTSFYLTAVCSLPNLHKFGCRAHASDLASVLRVSRPYGLALCLLLGLQPQAYSIFC